MKKFTITVYIFFLTISFAVAWLIDRYIGPLIGIRLSWLEITIVSLASGLAALCLVEKSLKNKK